MSVENVSLHDKLLKATERSSRKVNHGVYTPTRTGEDLPLMGTPTTLPLGMREVSSDGSSFQMEESS